MSKSPKYNQNSHANICLILEGTYPYVRGGVSSWVKKLIEGMPDLTFSIVFLGGSPDEYDKPCYEIPSNVVHIENHFLIGSDKEPAVKKKLWSRKADKSDLFTLSEKLHDDLKQEEGPISPYVVNRFTDILTNSDAITRTDLLHSDQAWESIREKYIDAPPGLDFNHFFWTVRTMHSPLFTLANIVNNAPPADMYHSVSTGYAGYLGAMLKGKTNAPYIITEHGIYTKEREIDLAQVDWIPEDADPFKVGLDENMSYLRQTWIRFFRSLGKMSYSSADHVYTLFNGNRLRQIEDGAAEERLTIIPNGIAVDKLKKVRRADDAPVPPIVALIGRIVPIKDIKTFIRGMRIVCAKMPDAQGWLVGPEDENPEYVEECRALINSFNLQDNVKLLGFQNLSDILPQIGLTVLTSVSEGQPLTTLEGFAAGIPAVTTDVGGCRELIYGSDEADIALGSAGEIIPIANPGLFAEAVIPMITDINKWRTASRVAMQRAETYYDEKDMLARYRDIYLDNINAAQRNNPMKKAEGF